MSSAARLGAQLGDATNAWVNVIPDAASRSADGALRSFGTLLEQDPDLLAKEVEKAKWLDPEDLFYVGFHFAEQFGRARQFGGDVLKLVLKRAPKGELAKSAKNKLKLTGLS